MSAFCVPTEKNCSSNFVKKQKQTGYGSTTLLNTAPQLIFYLFLRDTGTGYLKFEKAIATMTRHIDQNIRSLIS
jgi:hypothetical protein